MRVFERIGRMVRADAHGVMDQLEERSLLLKQHLREAEIELARKRASLEALDAERQRVREEGERLEARVAALDEDIEIARRGADPELARFAVRRWLPKQAALGELRARAAEIEARRARLAEALAVQETQLEALRPRVRAALLRPARAPGLECEVLEERGVSDEEVELELLRRSETQDAGAVESPPGAAREGE